ncbi:hypothetical protein SAMN05216404_11957 [Nitrosospira multiformis]|uniref:Uncharacterized protein n=2 Tax=Nitrosospira multiformis TaxID=1231 RepID=A0A1H8P9G4_9PROT|nr:hypothetical protein SAMN05216404_11957 [Nitrosospira multiformis]
MDGGSNVNYSLEALEEQGKLLNPTPPKIDLHDAHALRRELASVYRDMRAGRIETQDGTRLAYVLDLIRKAFETEDIKKRIELIEQTLERRKS